MSNDCLWLKLKQQTRLFFMIKDAFLHVIIRKFRWVVPEVLLVLHFSILNILHGKVRHKKYILRLVFLGCSYSKWPHYALFIESLQFHRTIITYIKINSLVSVIYHEFIEINFKQMFHHRFDYYVPQIFFRFQYDSFHSVSTLLPIVSERLRLIAFSNLGRCKYRYR